MASLPTTPPTEEQYLSLEREAETKSEFHDGQMFAMASPAPAHALLSNRVGALLDRSVPTGCRTYNADLRIKVPGAGLYPYADCTVVCGSLLYAGDRKGVVLNPLLIVEILSPSTEDYDRGKKFELYRTIETFREYLIVHQDRPHAEYYSKQDDGSRLMREYRGAHGAVSIARLDTVILLADRYAAVLD